MHRACLDVRAKLLAVQVEFRQLLYGRFAQLYGLCCLISFPKLFQLLCQLCLSHGKNIRLERVPVLLAVREKPAIVTPREAYLVGETASSFFCQTTFDMETECRARL